MKREIRGLKMLLIVLGLCLIVFDLLCPLPPALGVPGLLWRLVIGLLGCFFIGRSICAIIKEKKKGQ